MAPSLHLQEALARVLLPHNKSTYISTVFQCSPVRPPFRKGQTSDREGSDHLRERSDGPSFASGEICRLLDRQLRPPRRGSLTSLGGNKQVRWSLRNTDSESHNFALPRVVTPRGLYITGPAWVTSVDSNPLLIEVQL